MMFIGTAGSHGLFPLRGDAPRVDLVFVLLSQAGWPVESEKEEYGPEACHDRKSMKDGKNKEVWQDKVPLAATCCGRRCGQSSHEKWRSTKPQGKFKEIFAEIDAVETTVKEKTNTVEDKL